MTDEERCEVAAKLRENRDLLAPYNIVEYIFDDPWNHDSGEEVANRLADLIEPEERTCERGTEMFSHAYPNEIVCDSDCVSTYVFPLTCGHEVELLENKWPSYCPNCGAKVVE